MPSRTQVLQSIGDDCDYESAALRLHIPAGQAYLIATGLPADGGDVFPPSEELSRPGVIKGSTQHLVYLNLEAANPTQEAELHDWIRRRALSDPQMVAAARARDAEPGEPVDPEDTDVRFVLTRQHDKVTALMEQLKTIPGVSEGGSDVDRSRRESIADMMTVELSKHETAEQEHFWPKIREWFHNGKQLVEHAMQQEQEGKDSLVALGKSSPDDEHFDELVEELERRLRLHVAFEDKVLLSLPEVMSEDDRREVGAKILSAEKYAPTRPHPHAPKRPGGAVKAAAASAAPLDKMRDKVGARPAARRGRAESDIDATSQIEASEEDR